LKDFKAVLQHFIDQGLVDKKTKIGHYKVAGSGARKTAQRHRQLSCHGRRGLVKHL
jgi:hypothetical protein